MGERDEMAWLIHEACGCTGWDGADALLAAGYGKVDDLRAAVLAVITDVEEASGELFPGLNFTATSVSVEKVLVAVGDPDTAVLDAIRAKARAEGRMQADEVFTEMWGSTEYTDVEKPTMNFAADYSQRLVEWDPYRQEATP